MFVTHDKSYVFTTDTVLIIPSSLKYEIRPSKSDVFFNNLAQRADKSLLTRELHNIIVVSSKKNGNSDSLKTHSSALPYVRYSGKPIGNIEIRQLNVFGPTVDDTTLKASSWIEKTGNNLHFKTKEYLIMNNLIFKKGEAIDPSVLADNERILRQLPYIEDARILIRHRNALTDSVDIVVIVKDVWSTAFNINVDRVNTGRFEFWDRNLFGWGHEIQSNLPWDTRQIPKLGTENSYTINNISGSFITGKIFYKNAFQTESYGIGAERNFFTPNVKYAGGIALNNTNTRTNLAYDTLRTTVPIRYNSTDLWVGRSFLLNKRNSTKMRHNLTLITRLTRNQFFERPDISSTSYYDYQDKTLLLGAIAYSRQTFYKSNFIYNFGRTEDIPTGSKIEFNAGTEFNEFEDRSYLATKLSMGGFVGNIGYFYSSLNIGSFFLANGDKSQGIIDVRFNYFSPLIIFKNYKFRQFVTLGYTKGIDRFNKEYLTINNHYGLSGFTNDSLYGTKRFNMHWETVCFTPWSYYDFRFVLFIYADHSWLAKDQERLMRNLPHTSFGFGIRIRNERLVFNTIEIGFSLYPNVPSGSRTQAFEISGEPLLNPPNFLPQSPSLIPFK